MPFYNFVIYAKTDFEEIDFNGDIVTKSVITPIYITVEDNDDWLGGNPGTFAEDTNGQQTITHSSDPSLVGLPIIVNSVGSSQTHAYSDDDGYYRILDIKIGSNADYLMYLDSGVNSEMTPSTTYTEPVSNIGTSQVNYSAATLVCYAPGTLIDTPEGPRAVETLRPGDLVTTLDHGPQTIRWVRSSDHPLEEVDVVAKPVKIKAGALGRNLPSRDLIVSPQHRILVGGSGQIEGMGDTEAFAPAKSLTELRGIRHMKGKTKITWVHFACDQHEVVFANGCLSESLLLGPMVVKGLTDAEYRALTDVYGSAPSPDAALNGPPARPCLKVGEARRLLAEYIKEEGQSTAKEGQKWDRDLVLVQFQAERLQEETR